jgi:regulator of protease activity HflC (stomatin/prohibitin superfamily)
MAMDESATDIDGIEPDVDEESASGLPRWARRSLKRSGIYLMIVLLVVLFVMSALPKRIFHTITPGMRGVRWSMFGGGTVLNRDYKEGLSIIPPWDRMYLYDVRIQEVHGTTTVLTSNGLPVTVGYSVRFRPDLNTVPLLHQTYGPDYVNTMVRPEIISALREVIGNYRPETIYSRSENGLIDETYQALAAQVTNRYVVIQTVIIDQLRLTPELESAINQKLVDEQTALSYEFRLDRERAEAQRKEIEATGIRDFERTSGVSMLKWRGLEITEELSKSPNAKIIIMGTGANQLPLLLNGPGGL